MVAVLDQFEVEYKETYTSGTYDQVVMGRMFATVVGSSGKRLLVTSSIDRGVVYGAIEAPHAPTPGTSTFDLSYSKSYRSQPYKEKAGNCRAAKHVCYEERIYDTLSPNVLTCFKRNGARFFYPKSYTEAPGGWTIMAGYNTGVLWDSTAYIMLDNYVPPQNGQRSNFNLGVDRYWTRSFPFEPRYSSVSREKKQVFSGIETSYSASFKDNTSNNFAKGRVQKRFGFFIGTVASSSFIKQEYDIQIPTAQSWGHLWAADTFFDKVITEGDDKYATGSCENSDMMKILFGFGDKNTIFYTRHYADSENSTGYAMLGTNHWPEFRNYERPEPESATYDNLTSSVWLSSPIIRGWKYGLYNAMEDYSTAYFRQGRYGQFRDMLEQRMFTKFHKDPKIQNIGLTLKQNNSTSDSPVTVKFLTADGLLTDPERTQSQNLSFEATSSLPYFDLLQRNRNEITPITNLKMVDFIQDARGNRTL